MVSLTPGGIIDRLACGNQAGFNFPYEDSIEANGLKDAMFFNAIGWLIVAASTTFLIRSIKWACRAIVRALPSHAR